MFHSTCPCGKSGGSGGVMCVWSDLSTLPLSSSHHLPLLHLISNIPFKHPLTDTWRSSAADVGEPQRRGRGQGKGRVFAVWLIDESVDTSWGKWREWRLIFCKVSKLLAVEGGRSHRSYLDECAGLEGKLVTGSMSAVWSCVSMRFWQNDCDVS